MAWYKNAEEFMAVSGHEVEDKWYPRVTRILDIKAKPALEAFFKEMGDKADEVKEKSAAEGSLIHEVIQKTLVGKPVEVPVTIRPAFESFCEFNETRNIFFHPEYVERSIWSQTHRYSGTIDALASIDGKFGVLDIKTSAGFYPEYNLQTAAYVLALQEYGIKKILALPREIETRWILRINQHCICKACGATKREKGGRTKVKNGRGNGTPFCKEDAHDWSEVVGDIDLKEFPYFNQDIKGFLAAKALWEWDNSYWLRQVGYI